jgi:hypothetical protein
MEPVALSQVRKLHPWHMIIKSEPALFSLYFVSSTY